MKQVKKYLQRIGSCLLAVVIVLTSINMPYFSAKASEGGDKEELFFSLTRNEQGKYIVDGVTVEEGQVLYAYAVNMKSSELPDHAREYEITVSEAKREFETNPTINSKMGILFNYSRVEITNGEPFSFPTSTIPEKGVVVTIEDRADSRICYAMGVAPCCDDYMPITYSVFNNPHTHNWNYVVDGKHVKMYCDETDSCEYCHFQGIENAYEFDFEVNTVPDYYYDGYHEDHNIDVLKYANVDETFMYTNESIEAKCQLYRRDEYGERTDENVTNRHLSQGKYIAVLTLPGGREITDTFEVIDHLAQPLNASLRRTSTGYIVDCQNQAKNSILFVAAVKNSMLSESGMDDATAIELLRNETASLIGAEDGFHWGVTDSDADSGMECIAVRPGEEFNFSEDARPDIGITVNTAVLLRRGAEYFLQAGLMYPPTVGGKSYNVLYDGHIHDWKYMTASNILIAYCQGEDTDSSCEHHSPADALCLPLVGNGLSIEGAAKYCGIAKDWVIIDAEAKASWESELGSAPEIKYYKDSALTVLTTPENSGASKIGGAPVDVGQYYAAISIECEEEGETHTLSAKYGFGIEKRKLQIEFDIKDKFYDGTTAAEAVYTFINGSLIEGDEVIITGFTAEFESADCSTERAAHVDLSDAEITGRDADNYDPEISGLSCLFAQIKKVPAIIVTAPVRNPEVTVFSPDSDTPLITPGVAEGGMFYYFLDVMSGDTMSAEIPTSKNLSLGTHRIYYAVAGDRNHTELMSSEYYVDVEIKDGSVKVISGNEIDPGTTGSEASGATSDNLDDIAEKEKVEGKDVIIRLEASAEKEEDLSAGSKNALVNELKKVFPEIGNPATADSYHKEYLDIHITKSVSGEADTQISDTETPIEICINYPLNGLNKKLKLFRYHEGSALKFTELSERPASAFVDGTFYVDETNNKVYLYSRYYSDFLLAYVIGGHTVNFNTNGGNAIPSMMIAHNGTIGTLPIPTKEGVSFDGWFKDAALTQAFTNTSVVTEDITLFAKWSVGLPLIYIDDDKKPTEPEKPEEPTEPEEPEKPEDDKKPDKKPEITITKKLIQENSIAINAKIKCLPDGKKIDLSWGKVKDADGYFVYATYCGEKFELNKEIKQGDVTKVRISKIYGKALDVTRKFKLYVKAYKIVNGKKVEFGKSITIHIAGPKNKTNTNVKGIKLNVPSSITLEKGKSKQIKGSLVLVDTTKIQLNELHCATYRYASSDKKIATVDKNGKIVAKKKGTCYIYVYAANGYAKKIKVTVK